MNNDSGIVERRWVTEGTTPSDLALEASQNALKDAGVAATDIDMILVASLSPGFYFPSAACDATSPS